MSQHELAGFALPWANPGPVDESAMRRAIARKRDGEELEAAMWHAVVDAYVTDRVGEAQMAALLMACVLRGLGERETHALTQAFVASGETLTAPDARTVDKHSSGGVADTASLIVVPIVAACGVPVAKLSGRALGHTGGTLDKLEALEGVRTDLSPERFFACVAEAGCAIAAQSDRLVPADKRIYALRDRTSTVPAPGLIAASIVSKKIAGGARAIVYDVKAGAGAFVADAGAARELARSLVTLTAAFGRRSQALVTDMNEPLGPAIGTGLELIEARDFLRGTRRDPRLAAVCEALGVAMLDVAGYAGDAVDAFRRALASGAAYERFTKMLVLQGATAGALEALRRPETRRDVRALKSGFVTAIDSVALGEHARKLSACGNTNGIEVRVRRGARIAAGDVLATIFGDAAESASSIAAFAIDEAPPRETQIVYGTPISATDSASAERSDAPRSTLESK